MRLASRRIELNPEPPARAGRELEVLFLGHAPGAVRWSRFSDNKRAELRALGLEAVVAELPVVDEPSAGASRALLEHLPLPIRSLSEFTQIFPEAAHAPCHYTSALGENRAWLQVALEDFFHAGGRVAWVVVMQEPADPAEAVRRFLPARRRSLLERPEQLRGAELVALLSDVGLICCPDLERLGIWPATRATALEPPPLAPVPAFVPLAAEPPSVPVEPVPSPPPSLPPFVERVEALAALLAAVRKDVQLVITAPFAEESVEGLPLVDEVEMRALARLDEALLRRVQPLFPYLRSPRYRLASPCGLVAGTIARQARTAGVWRSIAGAPLRSDALPLPSFMPTQVARWREELDLGVLVRGDGALMLDDERSPSALWNRSAEVVRFMGWLERELTRLGNALVFRVDPEDPRPALALQGFGETLLRLGALEGTSLDDAFQIRRLELPADSGQVGYEVTLVPAFPIDKIVLSFVHTRERWQVEVARG